MLTKDDMFKEMHKLSMDINNKNGGVDNFLKKIKTCFDEYPHLIIYGAGSGGYGILDFIKSDIPEYVLNIKGFLDINADNKPEFLKFPVYTPDDKRLSDDFRAKTLVIFGLDLQDKEYLELELELNKLGYKNFINGIYEIGLFPFWPYKNEYIGNIALKKCLPNEINDVLTAFELMSDNHSLNIFFKTFRAHALDDWKLPKQSNGMTQYIDVEVPFRYKYRNFVDCGAFTGDTFKDLIKHHSIDNYIGLEPVIENFSKLSSNCDIYHDKVGKIILFPLGVSNTNGFLQFNSQEDLGSSRVDKKGKISIQVVRLDDLLKNYNNLMIKMDIEGSEIEALNGARRIITETQPDLAISIYHRISDLWRIPLILKNWVPSYQFYLRNHGCCTAETVLYCHT